jgi:hypothetical protein
MVEMRAVLLAAASFAIVSSAGSKAQSAQPDVGFPPYAFAQTWTSLPTDHFGPLTPTAAPVKLYAAHSVAVDDANANRLLDEAFASVADRETPRQIALNELMAPWPAARRTAFQKLRDTATVYARDDRHAQRFAALLQRVVDGTGRSVAIDGSASAALDTAYAATLSREDDAARARTEAAQTAFIAYREAFAAFADGGNRGMGKSVAAELDRERATDLAAQDR